MCHPTSEASPAGCSAPLQSGQVSHRVSPVLDVLFDDGEQAVVHGHGFFARGGFRCRRSGLCQHRVLKAHQLVIRLRSSVGVRFQYVRQRGLGVDVDAYFPSGLWWIVSTGK